MADEYAKIEEAYCGFGGDKDAFCLAFVQADGEKKVYQARAAKIEQLRRLLAEQEKQAKAAADRYEKENASLREQLDKELEWNHKTGNFACVTPLEADRILRKFYGLPEFEAEPPKPELKAEPPQPAKEPNGFINPLDFL